MYFCVNEFEVGVNDNIFSGNEPLICTLFVKGTVSAPHGLATADQ